MSVTPPNSPERRRLLRWCYWWVWAIFQVVPIADGLLTGSLGAAIWILLLVDLGVFVGMAVTLRAKGLGHRPPGVRAGAWSLGAAFLVGAVALIADSSTIGLGAGALAVLGSALGVGSVLNALYGDEPLRG
jgi:hypothetical protein